MQFTGPTKPAGSKKSAKQLQDRHALLVGLRQHGGTSGLNDLGPGQVGGGFGIVSVEQLALR